MKIIAESGATKSVWILIGLNQEIKRLTLEGIRPGMTTEAKTHSILTAVKTFFSVDHFSALELYCSGCHDIERADFLEKLVQAVFGSNIRIQIHSDLVAAAKATLGSKHGVVGILGTGSVAFYWNGEKVTKVLGGKGFPDGDEGSGADLGKQLVQMLAKDDGCLPQQLSNEIGDLNAFCTKAFVSENSARTFGQLTYFIFAHRNEFKIRQLIFDSFSLFFKEIMPLKQEANSICFVGSIAYLFEKELLQTAQQFGWEIPSIIQHPIAEIIVKNKKD